jgi:hypothetical protein
LDIKKLCCSTKRSYQRQRELALNMEENIAHGSYHSPRQLALHIEGSVAQGSYCRARETIIGTVELSLPRLAICTGKLLYAQGSYRSHNRL